MMNQPKQIAILAALLLTGCATPYTERSPTAASLLGGVSIEEIRPDTYRVYALGNVLTSPLQVREYVLRRAAKQAQELGFEGFRVVAGADLTRTELASLGVTSFQGNGVFSFGVPVASTYPSLELLVKLTNEDQPQDGFFRAADFYNAVMVQ